MEKKNNTNWLFALCITSAIAVVFTSLYDIMLFMIHSAPDDVLQQAMNQSIDNIKQMGIQNADEVDFGMLYKMIDNSTFHLLFNVIEVIGIFLLLRHNKNGIHFYLASQIGFAVVAYLTFSQGAATHILLCFIWSWLYWRATKQAEI